MPNTRYLFTLELTKILKSVLGEGNINQNRVMTG